MQDRQSPLLLLLLLLLLRTFIVCLQGEQPLICMTDWWIVCIVEVPSTPWIFSDKTEICADRLPENKKKYNQSINHFKQWFFIKCRVHNIYTHVDKLYKNADITHVNMVTQTRILIHNKWHETYWATHSILTIMLLTCETEMVVNGTGHNYGHTHHMEHSKVMKCCKMNERNHQKT